MRVYVSIAVLGGAFSEMEISNIQCQRIRSREHVLVSWLERNRPDVLCLQEIKCREAEFPFDSLRGPGIRPACADRNHLMGSQFLARANPRGKARICDRASDVEARLIAAKIDGIWIFNTYVPQGRSPDHPAFQLKLDFFTRLKSLFHREYMPSDPIIWTGDINVAPEDTDVFSPKRMEGKTGFHPLERQALAQVVSWGFIDLFRKHHPDIRQFTFWDYRLPQSFKRDLGWRLDHIRATEPVANASVECLVDADLRDQPNPSDHTPVWAQFEL